MTGGILLWGSAALTPAKAEVFPVEELDCRLPGATSPWTPKSP